MCPYNFQLKYTTWDSNFNFFMNFRVILPYFIDLLNFWRFTSINSHLNCKCALIWLNKLWKIIFTFHIRNVGSIHKENSISQPFYMISHSCNFDNTSKEIIENEKCWKIEILSHGRLLCAMACGENDTLTIPQNWKKTHHKLTDLVWRSMTFNRDDHAPWESSWYITW